MCVLIGLLDVAERARTGLKMEPLEYDMGLFRKTRELVARHRLSDLGRDEFWEVDNDYADRRARMDVLS
ncbi:hypothetical protein MUP00_04265 [Candidatus Bathyarchaeota archaeon]|nr:hypothetical protein [Candidatus Bathyarchaeota archaeon]